MRFDNNTLLSSDPPIFILLYTDSALMVLFLGLLLNDYPIFFVKLIITAKEIRLNKK